MSLQKNTAITLFGAPNDKGLTVSEDLSSRGVNLIRLSPSDYHVTVLAETEQPRYAIYKGLLPFYFHSNWFNTAVTTINIGYVTEVPDEHWFPLPWPKLAINWTAQMASEVADRVRNEFRGIDGSAGGQPNLLIPVSTKDDIRTIIREFNPNTLTPAPQETLNVQAFKSFLFVTSQISGISMMHQYCAFPDPQQHAAYTAGTVGVEKDEDIVAHRGHGATGSNEFRAPGQKRYVALHRHEDLTPRLRQLMPYLNKPHRPYTLKAGDGANFQSRKSYITSTSDLPNAWGRFFAYLLPLTLPDNRTVPDFIDRYWLNGLAEDPEEIHDIALEIRRDWGVIAKTEAGHILAHIVKVLEIAIEAQAAFFPIFTQGVYRGSVVSGYAWSASRGGHLLLPVPHDKLLLAVQQGDQHTAALRSILQALAGADMDVDDGSNDDGEIDSLAKLHRKIRVDGASSDAKKVIKARAHQLAFGGSPWPINVSTLREALALANMTCEMIEDRNLPIHHTMLLEEDPLALVWSCFGGMAPSFKIASGRVQELDKMKVTIKQRGQEVIADVSRIGVANVVLKQAIVDMRWVRETKSIQNPWGGGAIRASQKHQDRFFDKADAKALIQGLRDYAGVSLVEAGSGKRKAGDSGDAGPSKKRKGFDFF